MISLRKVPLGGDELTDWIFKQLLFFLRKETLKIKRKRRLLNPDDPRHKAIWGLMQSGLGPGGHRIEISINSSKCKHAGRDEEVMTLVHELCHVVFYNTRERYIRQMSSILVGRLTKEQIDFLKSFIPKYESK